jgi:hypothetical protein
MSIVTRGAIGWLLIVAGCGDDSTSIDSFPREYASAVCGQSFKCCTTAELEDHTSRSCNENTRLALSFVVGSIKQSQSRGRARFQNDQARACVEALAGMSCAEWRNPVTRDRAAPACNELVLGLVEDGKPCAGDHECRSRYCEGDTTEMDGKPPRDGACKAPAPPGGSCVEEEACASGGYCDRATMKCAATKDDGASCFDEAECKSGLCGDDGKCTSTPPRGACYGGCSFGCGAPAAPAALLLVLAALALRRRRA